jgi:hypothetical protein
MEAKETYGHIFQTFSALSDAQELLTLNRLRGANDQVNHSKRHLLAVIEGDEQAYMEVMRDLPIICTLPPETSGESPEID